MCERPVGASQACSTEYGTWTGRVWYGEAVASSVSSASSIGWRRSAMELLGWSVRRTGRRAGSLGFAGAEQADAAAVVELEVLEVLLQHGPQVLEAVLLVVEDALAVEVLHQPAARPADRDARGQDRAAEDDAARPD